MMAKLRYELLSSNAISDYNKRVGNMLSQIPYGETGYGHYARMDLKMAQDSLSIMKTSSNAIRSNSRNNKAIRQYNNAYSTMMNRLQGASAYMYLRNRSRGGRGASDASMV